MGLVGLDIETAPGLRAAVARANETAEHAVEAAGKGTSAFDTTSADLTAAANRGLDSTEDAVRFLESGLREVQIANGTAHQMATTATSSIGSAAECVGAAASSIGAAFNKVLPMATGAAGIAGAAQTARVVKNQVNEGVDRDFTNRSRETDLELRRQGLGEAHREELRRNRAAHGLTKRAILRWFDAIKSRMVPGAGKYYAELLIFADDNAVVEDFTHFLAERVIPMKPDNFTLYALASNTLAIASQIHEGEDRLAPWMCNAGEKECRKNILGVDVFILSAKEETGDGADLVELDRIGERMTAHIVFHTGFTRNTARHIFRASLTFYVPVITGVEPTARNTQVRILDCLFQNRNVGILHRIFGSAHFLTRGEDFSKYHPKVVANPAPVAAVGVGLPAVGQAAAIKWIGYGIVKGVSGACVAVGWGFAAASGVGGMTAIGLYAFSTYKANNVYLFCAHGPVQSITNAHKNHLKELYGWRVGEARKMSRGV